MRGAGIAGQRACFELWIGDRAHFGTVDADGFIALVERSEIGYEVPISLTELNGAAGRPS